MGAATVAIKSDSLRVAKAITQRENEKLGQPTPQPSSGTPPRR